MAAPTLEVLLKLRDSVSGQLGSITEKWKKHREAIRNASLALAAIGAMGMKFIATARELNAQLSQTGITLGISTAEMRGLAKSLTDVSFPLKSVTATLDILSRAGIRDVEMLKGSALAFDALADATGANAETLADLLIPAYKVWGLTLPRTAKELDKFTWLVKNTLVDLSDFAMAMQYVAREGANLGVTMDDMVAIMAILETRGISGSAATMVFREAITEAVGEGKSLNEVLGIMQGQLDNYKAKIEETSGITQQYADAANQQFTILDKLKAKFTELSLSVGTFLTPLEPLIVLLTAISSVAMLLSTSLGLMAVRWAVAGAAAVVAAAKFAIAAAAGIWATYGPLPFVGIALAIGATATMIANLAYLKGRFAAMAEGGIITRPTLALIGERGPEAVVPLKKSVTGNITVNVNVMGTIVAERDIAQTIRRELLLIKNRNVSTGIV